MPYQLAFLVFTGVLMIVGRYLMRQGTLAFDDKKVQLGIKFVFVGLALFVIFFFYHLIKEFPSIMAAF